MCKSLIIKGEKNQNEYQKLQTELKEIEPILTQLKSSNHRMKQLADEADKFNKRLTK